VNEFEVLRALAEKYEYHREIVTQAPDNPEMFIVTIANRFNVVTRRMTFIGAADLIVCYGRHNELFDEFHPDSAKINEQASIIRDLRSKIARLEIHEADTIVKQQEHINGLLEVNKRKDAQISALLLSLQGARNVIQRTFDAIARDLVIQSTHRARNAVYRIVARDLWNWQNTPHEDMDDIPF